MSENRVIGYKGTIPWDLPADRRRFRELTMGHPVIMGRKTFESIGRPLDGRRNIVISRRSEFRASGCVVAASLEDAVSICADAGEIFICGGESIYRRALPLADNIYLTVVRVVCDGDVFFPQIPDCFVETDRLEAGDGISCAFIRYRRRAGQEDSGNGVGSGAMTLSSRRAS
jgi:dihydrofolate reductase